MYDIIKYDALYARQSLDKKDSISIETQFTTCEYETHGHPFKQYSDKGYSGKNLNRPDFERLLEDIKQGLIKRVIVYKLDRISRSILDFSKLMETFDKYNVEFISTSEKFDTSTPVGRAMLNICIVFAQLERETIQERVADAYHSRCKNGFYMGGRLPYGFDKTETTINGIRTSMLISKDDESQEIQLVYNLYYSGNYSLGNIVTYLRENNINKTRGKAWSTSRLSEILRNPIYVQSDLSIYEFFKSQGAEIINPPTDFVGNGIYLYQGNVSNSRKQSDLKDKIVVLAPHKGIIPPHIWLACRFKCLNNKQSTKTCKPKNSWLSGKVKCGNCNYALVIRKSNTKWGRYFNCNGKENYRVCKGTGSTVYATVLEDYIFQAIKSKLSTFETLKNPTKVKNAKLDEINLELANIQKEKDILVNKVIQANDTLMEYINEKIESLHDTERKLQEKLVYVNILEDTKLDEIIYNHVEDWDNATFEDKQTVADILIKIIYVKNDEIIIEWNI